MNAEFTKYKPHLSSHSDICILSPVDTILISELKPNNSEIAVIIKLKAIK